jgi:hypothetical protein
MYIVQFQLIRDTSRQKLGWTLPDTVNTDKCSWWWATTSPETCRADLEQYINLYSASFWLFSQLVHDARIHERQSYVVYISERSVLIYKTMRCLQKRNINFHKCNYNYCCNFVNNSNIFSKLLFRKPEWKRSQSRPSCRGWNNIGSRD